MIIECPKCKKQYTVDGSKVTEHGVKITCPACEHQFIVRRKQDEAPAKTELKKPKTPPCAICGQPSTHVLKGPPPRPMCEHHYMIEKEKETRFFESSPGITLSPHPPGTAPPSDAGATRFEVSPDPGDTNVGQISGEAIMSPSSPGSEKTGAVSNKSSVPPSMSEPAFESFDDDFDFAGTEHRPPQSATPQPADDEEVPLADPHEFLDRLDGRAHETKPEVTAPPPSPPENADEVAFFDFRGTAPDKTAKETPSAEPDPFQPEARDSSEASIHANDATPSARTGSPEPEAFSPEEGESEEAKEKKPEALNLDGTPVDQRYSEVEEQEESFEWKASSSASKSARSSLDEELSASLTLEGEELSKPLPRAKGPELSLQADKPAKARSAAAAVSAILVLFIATAASAFLSFTGISNRAPDPYEEGPIAPPRWEGQLSAKAKEEVPITPLSLPELVPDKGMERAAQSAQVAERAEAAIKLMYKDTMASYDEALKGIIGDIALVPKNPLLYAVKIDILAFRESRDEKGKSILRGDESKRELTSLDSDLQDSPLMIRAKAHVYLNDQKTAAARALLKGYLEKNPRDGVALCLMGLTYRYQPKPDLNEAARYLEDATKAEPNLVRAYWDLAEIYREMGRYDDAIDMFNEVLTRSPEREGTAEAMEDSLRQKGQPPPGKKPETGTEPVVTIPLQPPPETQGVTASGAAISNNIIEVINEVEPKLRKFQPPAQNQGEVPIRRQLPLPPEEAPP